MVAVVYTRNVTLESVAAVQRRSLHWRELCEAVGLREKHLAVALNPSSKVRLPPADTLHVSMAPA